MVGQNAGLEISNGKYPFQISDMHTYSLFSSNLCGYTLEDRYKGKVPMRLVMDFVKFESYAGNISANPLKFGHCKME